MKHRNDRNSKKALRLPLILLFTAVFSLCAAFAVRADSGEEISVSVPLLQAGEFPENVTEPSANEANDSRLEKAEEAIRACLSDMNTQISLQAYSLTQSELKALFGTILNGTPEYFYVSNTYKITVSAGYIVTFTPAYHYSYQDVVSMRVTYEEKLQQIVSMVDPTASDLEKLLFLNDYFAVDFAYDSTLTVYDAYRFFTEKTGVCQSYTLAMIAVLRRLNIPVSFAQSQSMNHIWNLVSVNGRWYHLDLTWNDPVADQFGRALHSNFLLSDAGITATGHSGWTSPDTISCTDTTYDNYFWRSVKTPFARTDGVNYYTENGVIYSVDLATQKSTAVLTVTDNWPAAGKPGYYYSIRYVSVAAYDGCLFYNTPGSVHRYRIATGEDESFYTPGVEGSIFAMYRVGDRLRYLCAPTNDFTVSYTRIGDLILTGAKADVNSVLMTGTDGVTAFYPTAQAAIGQMTDPDLSYTLEPYLRSGTFTLSGGTLPKVVSLSFRGNGATQLLIAAPITLQSSLRVSGAVIHGASGASINLGQANVFSYAAEQPVLDLPVTGDVSSSVVFLVTGTGTGLISAPVSTEIHIGGAVRLTAPLNTPALHLISNSTITMEADIRCNTVTGTGSLLLLPVYSAEKNAAPCLYLNNGSDLPLTLNYSAQQKDSPVMNAPQLDLSRLTITLAGSPVPEDITLLFVRDSDGNIRKTRDSAFVINDQGVLITYISCISETLVTVPDTVTAIGDYAFASAPEPQEVFLPENIASVGMFGFGYVYNNEGSLVLSTNTVYRTQQNSVCEAYADAKGINNTTYFRAESGGYSVLCYPTRGDVSVIGHSAAAGAQILLPSVFDVAGIRYDDVVYETDIFAGQSGYTIFCPVFRDALTFASAWSETNTLYCKDEWFTVSFSASGALYYSYPSPAGAPVVLPEAVPEKEGDAQYSYPFTRWDGYSDGMTVASALRLTAVFTRTLNRYTFTFYDADGETVLAAGTLDYGSVVQAPPAPVKSPVGETEYVFTGWTGFADGYILTSDASFTAKYRASSEYPTEIESVIYRIEVAYSFVRKIGQQTGGAIFLSNFNDSEFLALSSGAVSVPSTSYVGTGMTLTLTVEGTVIQSLITVVTGDVSGDGKVTLTDFLQLKAHLLGKSPLSGAWFAAADLNGDAAVSITDLLLLKAYLLGKGAVVPQ